MSNVVLPPSDEGGVFCEAKDGGREKGNIKLYFLSLSFAYAQQLPRQREPSATNNQFTGSK